MRHEIFALEQGKIDTSFVVTTLKDKSPVLEIFCFACFCEWAKQDVRAFFCLELASRHSLSTFNLSAAEIFCLAEIFFLQDSVSGRSGMLVHHFASSCLPGAHCQPSTQRQMTCHA